MAKKSAIGSVIFYKNTPKKRPGRHKKRMSKNEKRKFKKYNGQGR